VTALSSLADPISRKGAERANRGAGSLLKSELAYQSIRARIADGTYPSGHRLVLGQLASELSVSPVPVREAIRRLEAEGYVKVRRNAGAQVASIEPSEYRQVVHVLGILEAAATALAAPLVTKSDLDAARRLNAELRATFANRDRARFNEANRVFHQLLYRRCPNRHLVKFIDQEWRRMVAINPSRSRYVLKRAKEAVDEHEKLLELIAKGASASTIEALSRNHRGTLSHHA
jgi:DNA-binding GntR family transcriptional regulator